MSYYFDASLAQAAPDQIRAILSNTSTDSAAVVLPWRDHWSVVFMPFTADSAAPTQSLEHSAHSLAAAGLNVTTVRWNDQVGLKTAILYSPGKSRTRKATIRTGFGHVGLPRDTPIHELIGIVCHGEDQTPFDSLPQAQRVKRIRQVLEDLDCRVAWGTLGFGAQQHFTNLRSYQSTRKFLRIQFESWHENAALFTPETLPPIVAAAIAAHLAEAQCNETIRQEVASRLRAYFAREYTGTLHEHL